MSKRKREANDSLFNREDKETKRVRPADSSNLSTITYKFVASQQGPTGFHPLSRSQTTTRLNQPFEKLLSQRNSSPTLKTAAKIRLVVGETPQTFQIIHSLRFFDGEPERKASPPSTHPWIKRELQSRENKELSQNFRLKNLFLIFKITFKSEETIYGALIFKNNPLGREVFEIAKCRDLLTEIIFLERLLQNPKLIPATRIDALFILPLIEVILPLSIFFKKLIPFIYLSYLIRIFGFGSPYLGGEELLQENTFFSSNLHSGGPRPSLALSKYPILTDDELSYLYPQINLEDRQFIAGISVLLPIIHTDYWLTRNNCMKWLTFGNENPVNGFLTELLKQTILGDKLLDKLKNFQTALDFSTAQKLERVWKQCKRPEVFDYFMSQQEIKGADSKQSEIKRLSLDAERHPLVIDDKTMPTKEQIIAVRLIQKYKIEILTRFVEHKITIDGWLHQDRFGLVLETAALEYLNKFKLQMDHASRILTSPLPLPPSECEKIVLLWRASRDLEIEQYMDRLEEKQRQQRSRSPVPPALSIFNRHHQLPSSSAAFSSTSPSSSTNPRR